MNCPYLTYEDYTIFGGGASQEAFPVLELRARKRLDHWTQNRIKEPTDDVKLCMRLIIDELHAQDSGRFDVSSVSHDGISQTFAGARTADEKMQSVYAQVVEILPVELITLCL